MTTLSNDYSFHMGEFAINESSDCYQMTDEISEIRREVKSYVM